MLDQFQIDDKFFQTLLEIDQKIAKQVAREGCPHCGGPLHRGDYPRKPRGGLIAQAGEIFSRRISLCCGRRGCRRRATPPSVRFLGRKVYLEVVILLACLWAQTKRVAWEIREKTGIPPRTVRRWLYFWQTDFVESRLFEEERGRFKTPLEVSSLPRSLFERFKSAGRSGMQTLIQTCTFLSPWSTQSVADGARFVRVD